MERSRPTNSGTTRFGKRIRSRSGISGSTSGIRGASFSAMDGVLSGIAVSLPDSSLYYPYPLRSKKTAAPGRPGGFVPRSPRRRKNAQLRGLVALVVVSLLASLAPALAAPPAAAAAAAQPPATPVVTRSQTPSMTVAMTKPSPSVPPTGTLKVEVSGSLSVPVDTLSVRLRVRRPSGKLLYQRTVERYEVAAGKFDIASPESSPISNSRRAATPSRCTWPPTGCPLRR